MTAADASTTGNVAPASISRPTERSFSTSLRGLNAAQKPGAGVPAYTRWVNRRVARVIAAGAHSLGLSPNAVTALSAVLSFIGLGLMITVAPTGWLGLPVGLLLALGYVFDSADGQVARLSGRGGPAGEWLDHVVDAVRTPAIHLSVLVGFSLYAGPGYRWLIAVAISYCLLSSGQFMSQILSEQLSGARRPSTVTAGIRQSFVLLPTDTGVLCLAFLLWGIPPVFAAVYTSLFVLNAVHTLVSMRRKYVRLTRLTSGSLEGAQS